MSKFIARTGRVQSWLDNPQSKLPVSCTVYVCEDSMEGLEGIEASWRFVSHALRNAAGVAVHLSKLRPRGTITQKGDDQLVASGPVSFARVYSTLNEVLRRGGTYKNGACVVHLDACHSDLEEFVEAKRSDLPWIKRCIDLTPEWWNALTLTLQSKILRGIQAGDLWLNKVKYDQEGERIYGNVCLEIYLRSRGTCLLQHLNMGQCRPEDLRAAFVEGMAQLVSLHGKTGVGDTGEYLPADEDRQVGLGLLGLSNMLAIEGIPYSAFGEALDAYHHDDPEADPNTPAYQLVVELYAAVAEAANIARVNGMVRAFTIAPTASCSYRHFDRHGFTTAPEIAPPISRTVDRDSGTFGVESFDYGPVEIASEVGWLAYKRVADGIVRMFEETGLFHGYSFNSWSDVVTYDQAFVQDWLSSPQTSLYYALQVMPDTLRKDDVTSLLEDGSDYAELFNFDQECTSCAE